MKTRRYVQRSKKPKTRNQSHTASSNLIARLKPRISVSRVVSKRFTIILKDLKYPEFEVKLIYNSWHPDIARLLRILITERADFG